MANLLNEHCANLAHNKATERKNACEALLELLSHEKIRVSLDTGAHGNSWENTFNSVKLGMNKLVEKLHEEKRKNGKYNPTTSLLLMKFNDLLRIVAKEGNRNVVKLNFFYIFNFFKRCINNEVLKTYCLSSWVTFLEQYVLPHNFFWAELSSDVWTELYHILKVLHHESHSRTIPCIKLIYSHGPKHKLPLHVLKTDLKFIEELCKGVTSSSTSYKIEDILELFKVFCTQIMYDYRPLCCLLGEETLINFLNIFQRITTKTNIRILILEVSILQIELHHPNGGDQLDKLTCFDKWLKWKQILRYMYSLVNNVLLNKERDFIKGTGNEFKLHPTLCHLAIEVYNQMFYLTSSGNISTNEPLDICTEPQQKKKCYESPVDELIDYIENNQDWYWIELATELFKKYPLVLSLANYERLTTFLLTYLNTCHTNEVRGQIFSCFRILLQYKSKHNYKTMLDWNHVYDSACRSIGLNQNLKEAHEIIQELITSLSIPQPSQLLKIYLSSVEITEESLMTIYLFGQFYNIPDMICSTEIHPKEKLLNWILLPKNNDHFNFKVTPPLIINLILKTWGCLTKSGLEIISKHPREEVYNVLAMKEDLFTPISVNNTVKQIESTIDVAALNKFLEITKQIMNNILESNETIVVYILNTVYLYTEILHLFKLNNLENCYEEIKNLLKTILPYMWEISLIIFKGDNYNNMITTAESFLKILEVDKNVDNFIKASIDIEVLNSLILILRSERKGSQNQSYEYVKTLAISTLCAYSINTNDNLQNKTLDSVLSGTLDPTNKIEYNQTLIILKSLEKRTKDFSEEELQNIFTMMHEICLLRYQEHDVALDILNILNTLWSHIGACKNNKIQENYIFLLHPLFEYRNNYGPKVSVALVICIGTIAKVDPNYVWSRWPNGDHIILALTDFLCSNSIEVRIATIRNILIPFSRNENDLILFNMQKMLFNKIKLGSHLVLVEEQLRDDINNKLITVLYMFGSIMVTNCTFRQKALYEIFNIAYTINLHTDQVQIFLNKVATFLNLTVLKLLENSLTFLLTEWNRHKNSLKDFPISIYDDNNSTSESYNFHKKYVSHIIPIIIQEDDSTLFQNVCNITKKSPQEVIRLAYPNIVARELISNVFTTYNSLEFNATTENIGINDKLKHRIETYLTEDERRDIKVEHFVEIIFKLVQFVFDPQHIRESFGVDYAFLKPDGLFISVNIFHSIIKVYMQDIKEPEETLMTYFIKKAPKKLQSLFLTLLLEFSETTDSDEKIIKFHHYSICLDLTLPHFNTKHTLSSFLIRDITFNLINIMKNNLENLFLNLLVIKFLQRFIAAILPRHSDVFTNFVILVITTLVPMACKEGPISDESINAIKLIFSNKKYLIESLRALDPFPAIAKFAELRTLHFHMKYGKQNCNLKTQIELFLKAGYYCSQLSSRTEGLRQLRDQLRRKKEELRALYTELYNRRVSLENSTLHQLVCALVELSTFPEESVQATKCLGELGISDLTTMVLKKEKLLVTFRKTPVISLCTEIIKLLLKYIVDANILVSIKSSEALYKILNSYEGKKTLIDLDDGYTEYLNPFLSSQKLQLLKPCNIRQLPFKHIIDDIQLWCPDYKIQHSEWIVKLVGTILGSFDENSFYLELIPVVELKIEFAEKIFPYLVNMILDINSESFETISTSISSFFKKIWDLYWNEKKDEDLIFMQKPAVQCMLNTVHFIRINRHQIKKIRGTTRLDLNLNYLHVALAASFCSAHFSAIMYAELWSESEVQDLKDQKPINVTKFDYLCSSSNDATKLHQILRQAHSNIGDINSLQAFQSIDPLNPKSQVEEMKDLDRWDLVVQHYDIQSTFGNNNYDSEYQQALKEFSCLNLLINNKKFNDLSYESLWRLGQWDLEQDLRNEKSSFEYQQYYSLKAFKEGDQFSFNSSINKGRNIVVNSLRHVSLESCREIYKPLQQLQFLQELEDAQVYFELDTLNDMVKSWTYKNKINPVEFKYQEQILAERITILKILSDKAKEPLTENLVKLQLNLAELARLDGNLNMATRAIYNLHEIKDLDEKTKAKIMIENVQILWKIDKNTGTRALKKLLDTYKIKTWERSYALKLYGTWMTELKLESSRTIIDYFIQSIEILNKLDKEGSVENIKNYYDAYEALARFSYQEYQELLKYTKSSVFQGKIKNMEKLEKNATKLREAPNADTEDIKRARITCERQSALDKGEIENTRKEMDYYLNSALKYYLFYLLKTNQNNTNVFRIFSLCLQNRSNSQVTKLMKEYLPKIETYKFINIIPQLVPHITNEKGDEFINQITLLIERSAKDHPHHVLSTILSVANANKDIEYSDSSVTTDLNEGRMLGAQDLIGKLKRSPMYKNMILQMEQLANALIQFAYYNASQQGRDDKLAYRIPGKYKIKAISNFTEILVPTLNLRINIGRNYENITGVYKYNSEFSLVGGINAPKLIKCIGTDGVTRNQLIKGKDDMRQDAVMQQVFNIMNGLLRANKNTFDLLIRTYKIIPLSKRSGVLQWLDNTEPIGFYLVGKEEGVHRYYYKKDWPVDKCRTVYRESSHFNFEMRLEKYLEICKNFRPAFHKFFQTRFLQPTILYERRRAYTQSVATTSMCGYILGIGDRHVQNILVDKNTAEVIHIDFGIAFEQGRVLPTPECVPFRLSRDIEDGMGIVGTEGTFKRSCEKTMEVLRSNASTIITIVEVLLYDPLYAWTVTPAEGYSRQMDEDNVPIDFSNEDSSLNVTADRALNRLRQKLLGTEHGGFTSVEGQVARLIQEARDPANLSKMFYGWQPYL